MTGTTPDERPYRVLIAEDEPATLMIIQDRLVAAGYTVIAAEDGPAALKLVASEQPDLLLVDYMMPGMTGIEVIQKIKTNPDVAFLPIILLTARAQKEFIIEGLDAGADDYIAKPFDPQIMAARIRSLLRIKVMHDRVRELTVIDELTGAFNRRYLFRKLRMEIARATRYTKPLSLAMIDIDQFRQINDQHGHQCGDAMLVEFVQLVKNSIRAVDVFARYSGEDFALILPETGRDGAQVLAERLCETVAGHAFQYQGAVARFTISSGICTLPLDPCSGEDTMLRTADRRLALAKRQGHNRVVSSDTITSATP